MLADSESLSYSENVKGAALNDATFEPGNGLLLYHIEREHYLMVEFSM